MAKTPPPDPKSAIRDQALEIGFDAVGFAPAELGSEAAERLQHFLAHGRHGSMGWLCERAPQRSNPKELWPEARSVIVLGMNYGPDHDPMRNLALRDRGNISVYARNKDYHDTLKKRLKQLAKYIISNFDSELKVFVDTAPVMEKPLAAKAGLGWQGKHSNLVSRQFGSWLFLGEIYTTLDLAEDKAESDHCGRCSRCLDICPTNAFVAPYQLDARRCISYLTIENKGPIPESFRKAIGNRIYGCDDCLAVCPWNKFASEAREPHYKAREELNAPRLAELANLDDKAFRALFSGSPIKRIGRDRFVRNVMIAVGNSGEPALLECVRNRLEDESPLVRGAAIWAFRQLADPHQTLEMKARLIAGEGDADVRREWN
ncbi:tRNA epoxyqueuosine(34) reductase QueG [Limibacillus sp. MBR-115]|jgi:epoxyqueuosine reductase|uniref:tRNA epoxyqueuosine(34) reductase QueG n=1 Tax=Limibacillus sp. MBR-115 TaxID=3156465 RepID=UPI003397BABE